MAHLGNCLAIEANNNSAELLVTMLNIEKDFVGDLGAFSRFRSLSKEKEGSGQKDQERDDDSLYSRHFDGKGT